MALPKQYITYNQVINGEHLFQYYNGKLYNTNWQSKK